MVGVQYPALVGLIFQTCIALWLTQHIFDPTHFLGFCLGKVRQGGRELTTHIIMTRSRKCKRSTLHSLTTVFDMGLTFSVFQTECTAPCVIKGSLLFSFTTHLFMHTTFFSFGVQTGKGGREGRGHYDAAALDVDGHPH